MKKIATLATYQPRFIKILWDAVQSLAPQTDLIYVNINPPYSAADMHKLEAARDAINERDGAMVVINYMKEDLGDLAKFWPLTKNNMADCANLILVCDDDWIYPADYATVCQNIVTGHQSIYSFGGKRLKQPPYTHFKDAWDLRISQHLDNGKLEKIDVPLTCVTAFQRDTLPPYIDLDLRYRNNGDVLLAKIARENDVKIFAPTFKKGWLKYHPQMHVKETIWGTLNETTAEQQKLIELYTEVMNVKKVEV